MADDDKFLSRWARRKAESRAGTLADEVAAPDAPAPEEEQQDAALTGANADTLEADEDHPAAGIDIESLDANSDFSVFMHEKVPQAIRRRALRKLWWSDPIYANLDGLNDYDEDFTDAALVVEGLKATYDEAVERMKKREAEEAATGPVAEAKDGDDAPEDETSEDETADDGTSDDGTSEDDEQAEDGTRALAEADDDDLDDGTDEA